MGEAAFRVEGLGKKYRIGALVKYKALRDTLTQALTFPIRAFASLGMRSAADEAREAERTVWALKDLSFDIHQGDIVGIIGRNGAGKSTLLKILSRIVKPTEGRAVIRGRVGALLEVGVGFHPELTGRENIFLNGAILGMHRAEIRRKFDPIVAFAEIEKFIDTPVKYYSSGMYMRLAFSVAAHLEPEVLLVDEVLAVGDTAFQKKCLGKMEDLGHSGRTIIFVSHNMGAMAQLCRRGIVLDQGRLAFDGGIQESITAYMKRTESAAGSSTAATLKKDPALPCSILEVQVSAAQRAQPPFDLDDELIVEIKYEVLQTVNDLIFNLTLNRNTAELLNTFDTDREPEIRPKTPAVYVARHTLPARLLKAGLYSLSVGSGTPERCFQLFNDVLQFEVEELSENTHLRGYRKDRPGHLISPGRWETSRISGGP